MAREFKAIDVTNMPDVVRLAEEVGASGEARVLRRNGKDLAVVVPLPSRAPGRGKSRKPKSQDDIAAFRSAAGSWDDVDTDRLIADIYESRRTSRPAIEL